MMNFFFTALISLILHTATLFLFSIAGIPADMMLLVGLGTLHFMICFSLARPLVPSLTKRAAAVLIGRAAEALLTLIVVVLLNTGALLYSSWPAARNFLSAYLANLTLASTFGFPAALTLAVIVMIWDKMRSNS